MKNENLLFLTDSYVEMGVLFWREKIRLIIIDYYQHNRTYRTIPTVCLEWMQVKYFFVPLEMFSTHISIDSYDENDHY